MATFFMSSFNKRFLGVLYLEVILPDVEYVVTFKKQKPASCPHETNGLSVYLHVKWIHTEEETFTFYYTHLQNAWFLFATSI